MHISPTVKKKILFWASISVLGALLRNQLPASRTPAWEAYGLRIGAVYVFFRGTCVIIHNTCVWIAVKTGLGEEKKPGELDGRSQDKDIE